MKKFFTVFLSLTLLCGLSFGFSFKKAKFHQNGLLVKYKANSKIKPLKIEKDGAYFKVYLNEKDPKDVVITAQQFISRLLDVIQFGAKPITVEKDKSGVFLKIPVFTKMYRYEAIINGFHFWFYIKK